MLYNENIKTARSIAMNKIIIYGSCYGNARRYAEELSQKTGIPAVSFDKAVDLDQYQHIIYIGALYAGGVMGLAATAKKFTADQRLTIATVGLADPTDPVNESNIKKSLGEQIPQEIFDKAEIFHLRGGIDYKTLGAKHKAMMWFMYKQLKKKPQAELTAEDQAVIETYG